MSDNDLALTAHLMRRAGFGATREELEELSTRSYESLVDDLIDPERFPQIEDDVLDRYYGEITIHNNPGTWLYRMVNTRRPLEEKMVLFLHQVFATAYSKDSAPYSHLVQLDLFRRVALSDWRTILIEVSKDPLMISWLDNSENHKDEPNENYGREVLELFSMGIGSYTEDDVKECARAFTGWTFAQPIPLYPCGHFVTEFEFLAEDHDDGRKSFLGHTGNFNGEDIIDIIVRQPATAEFVTRHLYSFFVADEPQVPAWSVEPPRDPKAIDALSQEFIDTGGSLRPVLRLLFNSDFFKEARYARVKSPAELVAGTIKLAGTHRFPDPGLVQLGEAPEYMGQHLTNPPTVEGWHTGHEWIDGGALTERVNFAADELGDVTKPGVREMIERISGDGSAISPEELVDRSLDLVGPVVVSGVTRDSLLGHFQSTGDLTFETETDRERSEALIARALQLAVSTREYQFA